jgi:DNA primase
MSRRWWPLPSQPAELTDERRMVAAHYARFAPFIVAQFGAIPLIIGMAPRDAARLHYSWVGPVDPEALPAGVQTVRVFGDHGARHYITASETTIEWLAELGAVEFWSWTPVPGRPEYAGYVHLWIGPGIGKPTELMVRETCTTVRAVLGQYGVEGALYGDGSDGYIMFIRAPDAARFADLDDFLFAVVYQASEREPELCSVLGDDSYPNLVQVRIDTNEPEWGVPLPYSLRARAGLPMVTPIVWSEL